MAARPPNRHSAAGPPADEQEADDPACRDRQLFEEDLRRRLGEIYSANPWLIATEIDQGAARQAAAIQAVADVPVLAVGARAGIGPVQDGVQLISLALESTGTIGGDMETAAAAIGDPGPEIMTAIDAWDPDGAALVIGGLKTVAGRVAGRRTFGARPRSWADLEDKLAIEAVWASAGIPTAPSVQLRLDDAEALLAAHRRLATGSGTVWAGDNTPGSHGGGEGTFWVPTSDAAVELQRTLRAHERVRIMPFVEGIPCSIHGMVLPNGAGGADVVTFRPMEMMILRDPAAHRFVYGRAGSHWDPAPADRRAMKAVALAIGRELRRLVGYRGTFTVDGVLGVDGFVPTEVNPRYGAALPSDMETRNGPPIDLQLVNLALIQGVLDDLDAGLFQHWVVENLDRNRRAGGYLDIEAVPDGERSAIVSRDPDGRLTATDVTGGPMADGGGPASASGPADGSPQRSATVAEVRWGPTRNRGMLMVTGGPAIPNGPPTAPVLIEVLEAVDRHWDLGLPRLTAARSVRP